MQRLHKLLPIFFLVTFAFSGMAEPMVSVVTKAPRRVPIGTGFVVSLTVNKGKLGGFARVLQTIPAGYKAEALDTWGARFQQTGQDVKFIWLELPADSSFTISYRVNPENETTEPFMVSGSFSYLKDNKNVKLPIASTEVTVGGPDEEIQEEPDQPTVTRRLLTSKPEEGEYIVELSIQHSAQTDNARFIDYVPTDYVLKPLQTGTARFTAENGRANFFWDMLPADETIVVTYMIRSGRPEERAPKIQGVMLYGDDAEDKMVTGADGSKKGEEKAADEPLRAEKPAEKKSVPIASKTPDPTPSGTKSTMRNPIDNGLRFKVQIVATKHSPVRSQSWFRTNMGNVGVVEFHQFDGWNKYQLGSYPTYEEASNARQKARSFAEDAFIVAYKDGSPISVKSALEIQQAND